MSASLYEIIELPNGDVVLRRADEDGEPLVSIRFSEESTYFLKGGKFEIAKAMLETGMEVASELTESEPGNAFREDVFSGEGGAYRQDGYDEDADEVYFELEDSARVLH